MALTLTIGTNTFVTLAEANNYLEGKLGASDWFTLTDTEKKQCLISSFRWLLRLGVPATATATNVKYAQIELAWWLYQNYEEYEDRDALYASGVRNFRIGQWSESLAKAELPSFLEDLIPGYLDIGGVFPEFSRELDE